MKDYLEKFENKIKPCPCCGESISLREEGDDIKGIYWGVTSCDTMGVSCYSCGLKLSCSFPDEWPDEWGKWNEDVLNEKTLEKAINRWNTRKG